MDMDTTPVPASPVPMDTVAMPSPQAPRVADPAASVTAPPAGDGAPVAAATSTAADARGGAATAAPSAAAAAVGLASSASVPVVMGYLGAPIDPDFDIEKFYELGKQLGTGNFSKVYEGRSRETGELYAVKVIKKAGLHSAKHLRSLQTEIEILKACRHPNIVCLVDVREAKNELYLVLELARGGELFEQIAAHGAYSERDAANIVRQIVKAIVYLHDQGIAHRDIKPENILLAEPNSIKHIKLADFGLAKILSNITTTSTPCGTPGYVAPEVLLMMGYDKAVDLWSIGVITYILLCGYPPFHDKIPAQLYDKIKKAQYRFHDKYWIDISEQAKDLIRKLLVVNPRERLTARQALSHPWLSGLSTPAQPLPALYAQLRQFQAERKGKATDSAAPTTPTAELAGFLADTPQTPAPAVTAAAADDATVLSAAADSPVAVAGPAAAAAGAGAAAAGAVASTPLVFAVPAPKEPRPGASPGASPRAMPGSGTEIHLDVQDA